MSRLGTLNRNQLVKGTPYPCTQCLTVPHGGSLSAARPSSSCAGIEAAAARNGELSMPAGGTSDLGVRSKHTAENVCGSDCCLRSSLAG